MTCPVGSGEVRGISTSSFSLALVRTSPLIGGRSAGRPVTGSLGVFSRGAQGFGCSKISGREMIRISF